MPLSASPLAASGSSRVSQQNVSSPRAPLTVPPTHPHSHPPTHTPLTHPQSATFNVLNSSVAFGNSPSLSHVGLRASEGAPLRFTSTPSSPVPNQPANAAAATNTTTTHATHHQLVAARAAAAAADAEQQRTELERERVERERERDAAAQPGLHQRRQSRSYSSRTHKTDMNGHVYDEAPHPPPMSSLHRSPSFDKRLIDSARFAGFEAEQDDEDDTMFTCAGLCAGSCCVPTSSASSSSHMSYSGDDTTGPNGQQLSSSELMKRRRDARSRCHAPTYAFVFKVLAVLAVIAAGISVSIVVYDQLHSAELDHFRDQLKLLCVERSSTIQSQLNFSTTVLEHHLALFNLVKNGSATAKLLSLGTAANFFTYANVSDTFNFLDFVLFMSVLRNESQARAWEANTGVNISYFSNGTIAYYNTQPGAYNDTWFARHNGAIAPTDIIVPSYANFDLVGWDALSATRSISNNLRLAATIGSHVVSNRSTLLQTSGYSLVVIMPLFSTLPVTPDSVAGRLAALIGGVAGIIPLKLVVERALATLDPRAIDITLYDRSGTPATAFLYDYYYSKTDIASTPMDVSEATSSFFDYGQRTFEVECIPSSAMVRDGYSSTPILIAVGCAILFGAVLVMVVIGCLYASMRRAILRSAQLVQANRSKSLALDLLHEAKRIADDANQSKSDFLAFLCHELRNPLHAVTASIDFLLAPEEGPDPITGLVPPLVPLSASQQESINTIESSVRAMATIVNDALDLSKIEAGKITFEILRFSFADLVNSLAVCEKPRAQAKGIQLLLNIHPNVPSHLYGDPTRIRQVCTNLLSNAIKFTSKGYVIISVAKISVDEFALPMMAAVEEAGESKLTFQSDLSQTLTMPPRHQDTTAPGSGAQTTASNEPSATTGYGLNSSVHGEYRQPPGATPAVASRHIGGLSAVGSFGDVREEEEALMSRTGGGGGEGPSPSPESLHHPDIELVQVGPAAFNGRQPTHAELVARLAAAATQVGVRRPTTAPILTSTLDYSPNTIMTRSIAPSGVVVGDAAFVGSSSAVGTGTAAANTPNDVEVDEDEAGLVTTPPTAPNTGGGQVAGEMPPSPPHTARSKSRPITHVPLQPSSMPSSEATLIDVSQGADRPALVNPPTGISGGSGGSARETLPLTNSRIARDVSSSTSSTFASEPAIIELSVTDTGMGIDAATLPLLFEPYSQAKLSVMRSFGGTGLGLAIVKQICEMMQGSISVQSQVGEGGGTSMIVRLPLHTAPAHDSSGEASETSSSHTSSQSRAFLPNAGGAGATSRHALASRPSGSSNMGSLLGLTTDSSNHSPPVRPLPGRAKSGVGGSVTTPQSRSGYSTMDSTTLNALNAAIAANMQSTTPSANSTKYATLPLPTPAAREATLNSTSPLMLPLSSSQQPHAAHGHPYAHSTRDATLMLPPVSPVVVGGRSHSDNTFISTPGGSSGGPTGITRTSTVLSTLAGPSGGGGSGGGSVAFTRSASPQSGVNSRAPSSLAFEPPSTTTTLPATSAVPPSMASPQPPIIFHEDPLDTISAGTIISTDAAAPYMASDRASSQSSSASGAVAPVDALSPVIGDLGTPVPVTPPVATPFTGTSASDVRGRLAALAVLPDSASSSSAGSSRPPKASRSSHRESSGGSSSSAKAFAKSQAAALAAMSLAPYHQQQQSHQQHQTDGSPGASGGSLAALAASRSSASSSSGASTIIHPRDVRVLIADDSPTNLKILARMLVGFQVTQALNGLEAVERVKDLLLADPPLQPIRTTEESEHDAASDAAVASGTSFVAGFSPVLSSTQPRQAGRQFDVILSDVCMPVMSGLESAREIRRLERLYGLPPVPLVALTANAFLDDRNKCAAAGMSLFVAKPFSKANILSIIQLVCAQNGAQLQLAASSTTTTGSSANGRTSTRTNKNDVSSFLLPQPTTPPQRGVRSDGSALGSSATSSTSASLVGTPTVSPLSPVRTGVRSSTAGSHADANLSHTIDVASHDPAH